jgi:hypothetical protein
MARITKYILPILVFLSVHGFGQSQKNPFDLLHRKPNLPVSITIDSTKLSDPSIIRDSSGLNVPLEIKPDAVKTEVFVDSHKISSLENKDTTTIIDQVELLEARDESNQDTISTDSTYNPFDLQDVPPELNQDTILESAGPIETEEKDDDDNQLINQNEDASSSNLAPVQNIGKKISGAFLALIFLGIFLLLTIIVNINRGLLNKIYRASLNENFSALLYRERKHSSLNYLYSIAYVIFFINVGLFIYLIQFLGESGSDKKFPLWLLTLAPIAIYVTRHLIMRVLAHVFPITKEVNQFNFNIVVFNIMIGLVLIPINLFLAYGPSILHLPILYGTIFILAGLYLFRQLRGVLISSSIISTNVFLFFIYLCTVEILPIAVLLKILV